MDQWTRVALLTSSDRTHEKNRKLYCAWLNATDQLFLYDHLITLLWFRVSEQHMARINSIDVMWAGTEQCTWMQSFAQINTAYNLQSSAFVSQKGLPKNINKHLVTTITRNSRSTDCVLVNFGAHVLPEARRQLHVSVSVFRKMFGLYVLPCPKWQQWNTHIKNVFSLIWLEAKLISHSAQGVCGR